MTHQTLLQDLKLKSIDFGGPDNNLFQILEGGDLNRTLELAVNLNLAVSSFCGRLDFCINNNEDPVTCAELRALAHLSDTATALIQQIRYGFRRVREAN